MTQPNAVLVSMPWEMLDLPSIQLGLLKPTLEAVGYRTRNCSFYLALMEHLISSTRHVAPAERIEVNHYQWVASRYWTVGMGDWIFAVPPFRPVAPDLDLEYFDYLRNNHVPEEMIGRAAQMRDLIPAFLEQCLQEILASSPQLVGFTTSFSQNVASLVLARQLKQRAPETFVVFGGANCEGTMGATLHRTFPWVDAVVRGEGEYALASLASDLLHNRPITPYPGLCYRQGGAIGTIDPGHASLIPMDQIPVPDYDEYFERLRGTQFSAQILAGVKLLIETARGCWWGQKQHCTFCGLNGTTMTFRSKSPQRAVEDVMTLASRYQRLDFDAVDNILDSKYLETVLPMWHRARQTGNDFTFFFETKSNLKRDQVRLMRNAGITRIQPGIESLSTPILKLMRKGVTALQNIRLLKWAAQYNIQVTWNIIYGFPGEPETEYIRMAELTRSLSHLKPPNLVALRVQRFSPYYERAAHFGLELTGPMPYYRFLYPTDDETLMALAYEFTHAYADGRTPEEYVGTLRTAIAEWDHAYYNVGPNALRYWRGPGFLKIIDRRDGRAAMSYTFGATEAKIYLCCDSGAMPHEIWHQMGLQEDCGLTIDDIREFLDTLVTNRLVYEEQGRYLSLALAGNTDAEIAPSGKQATVNPYLTMSLDLTHGDEP